MSQIKSSHHTLHADDPVLQRTGHNLGVSWLGANGSPGQPGYQIHLLVIIPKSYPLWAIFPENNPNEVSL